MDVSPTERIRNQPRRRGDPARRVGVADDRAWLEDRQLRKADPDHGFVLASHHAPVLDSRVDAALMGAHRGQQLEDLDPSSLAPPGESARQLDFDGHQGLLRHRRAAAAHPDAADADVVALRLVPHLLFEVGCAGVDDNLLDLRLVCKVVEGPRTDQRQPVADVAGHHRAGYGPTDLPACPEENALHPMSPSCVLLPSGLPTDHSQDGRPAPGTRPSVERPRRQCPSLSVIVHSATMSRLETGCDGRSPKTNNPGRRQSSGLGCAGPGGCCDASTGGGGLPGAPPLGQHV